MNDYTYTPQVNAVQEFKEIAKDFSNPLDVVREAISNSFDARADNIYVSFDVEKVSGEDVVVITIKDDGDGMNADTIKQFFDLGNSTQKDNPNTIGEKGHGTKVYFNSKRVKVITTSEHVKYTAIMESPREILYNNGIPNVFIHEEATDESDNTTIIITGYNNNRSQKFTHEILKDYIMWFTKFGSIEKEFSIVNCEGKKLKLKGIDRAVPEDLSFGHFFPQNSISINRLFDEHLVDAPKRYCRKIIKNGELANFPYIKYNAVFCIEGTYVKYEYNPMVRRRGYPAPRGAYSIQERYGLWVCKDYIPIQQKNEWINKKGNEHTRLHAFINCQRIDLTANRGSIDNTPQEILDDLKLVIEEIYEGITNSDDWRDMDWLESQADSYKTVEKEEKDFEWRIGRANTTKVASYEKHVLIEPNRESGVYALFIQLNNIRSNLFPFEVIDYDTHTGIDVIVKAKDTLPIKSSRLFYVEFKYYLDKDFNHSYKNLYSIVCWDINPKNAKHNDEISDISGNIRLLKIIPPEDDEDYTRYYLDDSRGAHKIEIYVLRQYLEEKCGIVFKPRTENSTY